MIAVLWTQFVSVLVWCATRLPTPLAKRLELALYPPTIPGDVPVVVCRMHAFRSAEPQRRWRSEWTNALAAARALREQLPTDPKACAHAQRIERAYRRFFPLAEHPQAATVHVQ